MVVMFSMLQYPDLRLLVLYLKEERFGNGAATRVQVSANSAWNSMACITRTPDARCDVR